MVGTLELLGGSIEVIAWPDLFEETRELWQEGALLWVVGRVRDREGETSIHCDEVRPFQLEEKGAERAAEEAVHDPAPAPPTASQQVLLISLVETGEVSEDTYLVHEVLRACLEYPGTDRVNVEIRTGGQRVRLDVPIVATRCCPELRQRLERLIGPGSLRILNGTGNGDMP